jgi:hypothetical protein
MYFAVLRWRHWFKMRWVDANGVMAEMVEMLIPAQSSDLLLVNKPMRHA